MKVRKENRTPDGQPRCLMPVRSGMCQRPQESHGLCYFHAAHVLEKGAMSVGAGWKVVS